MSDYYRNLDNDSKSRYCTKLQEMGIDVDVDDPMLDEPAKWSDDVNLWPSVEFGSIYVYLIDTPGPFTRECLRAYRSLEAYTFFVDGWVAACYSRLFSCHVIIKANVMRSQAVTDKPHSTWVGIHQKDGHVHCGHCTCMAGLGEVCSHVAAILFKLEYATRFGLNQTSCTSEPCQWNKTSVKKVMPATVTDIDFKRARRDNEPTSSSPSLISTSNKRDGRTRDIRNTEEFIEGLRKFAPDAVVLTVIKPVIEPLISAPSFPLDMNDLFQPNNVQLNQAELHELVDVTFRSITANSEQCAALEQKTRLQSSSQLWHQYRKGRITASVFHAVMHTDIDAPAKSVLDRVMQYAKPFSTAATRHGLLNENIAAEHYASRMSPLHTNFKIENSGLVVCAARPHLGASPDRWIDCECHGKGIVEIKCPFKHRNVQPCSVDAREFCLQRHEQQEICANHLRKNHSYYTQVQGQLAVTGLNYCDFVCYTAAGLHIERIEVDKDFCDSLFKRLDEFFVRWILPQVLTGQRAPGNDQNVAKKFFCVCGVEVRGTKLKFIVCANATCSVTKYHLACIGIENKPRGKWFCDKCR